MSWGAVAGAAIGVVGSAMTSDKGGGGGGGGQTASSEPWMPAQPWMMQNIMQGQNLQTQYQNKPFSPEQQAAIRNQYGQSDYMRNLVPSLLGQMSGQQVGFDRNNPNARPQAWDWTAPQTAGSPNLNQSSLLDAVVKEPEKQPEPEKKPDPAPVFQQLDGHWWTPDGAGSQMGSYGSFKFGDPVDPKNAQQLQDLRMYYALGGRDPFGQYAEYVPDMRSPWMNQPAGGA